MKLQWEDEPLLCDIERGISGCDKCYLSDKPHVCWRGNPKAKLMIVGEAPGKHEHLQGKPWVGPAGQELDSALKATGINPSTQCFITNVVKARPVSQQKGKENDTPRVNAIKTCSETWLEKEIEELKPTIILCMGKSAAVGMGVAKSTDPMSKLNNMTFEKKYKGGEAKVFVTYHTASYLYMRGQDEKVRKRKWEIFDVMCRVKEHLNE